MENNVVGIFNEANHVPISSIYIRTEISTTATIEIQLITTTIIEILMSYHFSNSMEELLYY